MGMLKQNGRSRLMAMLRINHPLLLLFTFALLTLSFSACALRHATLRTSFSAWRCEARVRDTLTLEPVNLISAPPFNPLPSGGEARLFIMRDWDGDGDEDISDVTGDWRRYIVNRILVGGDFAGRTWCVEPGTLSCSPTGDVTVASLPPVLPSASLPACPPERSDARLEISAPGLTPAPDFRLGFPDTPIGLTSSPITITLRNAGTSSLRLNSTDLLGALAGLDFIEPVGSNGCLPTADEMRRGVGRELARGRTCDFQVQFRPLYRPGVGECDRDDTMAMTCNRVAALRITSMTLGGRMLSPLTVNLSGRAIGGRLVVEPASSEICFTPPATPLTDFMCTEDRMITIRNEGTRATTGDINITSSGSIPIASFNTMPISLEGRTLIPGESVEVRVRYCERRDRSDGVYRIYSSAPRGPNPVEIAIFNPNNRTCP